MNFLPMGEGTERLAERLSVLAGGPVLRLGNAHANRRPSPWKKYLRHLHGREAPILVGTQMLSKGHHFPLVTLAVIADADLGLNLPDYRAAERTFQLLVQSAGRAGQGRQTGPRAHTNARRKPLLLAIRAMPIMKVFYKAELARRKLRRYPPFVRLALIMVSYASPNRRPVRRLLANLPRPCAARPQNSGAAGARPRAIAPLRGRKRFTCLIKGQDWQAIRSCIFLPWRKKLQNTCDFFLTLIQ